jgi:uncharacterized cupredoxin-like copper-binding protein
MKVNILERERDYKSDYPEGWVFSKGDYFKKVLIEGHTCFVKRFEVSRPENISGWKLMMNLKGKNKENLVKLYDIVETTEKNYRVCYAFYEFIEGETLHKLILNNEAIDLRKLTKDLFNAIRSLYESGYWFADFTEKNIFYSKSGKYVLIDIDSAQPSQLAPDNDMWGDKAYWISVLDFYKNILHEKNFRLAGINGISLNYLQLIFLILRIKLSDSNKAGDYFSSDLHNLLPAALNKQSTLFKKVFSKVQQRESFALQNDEITEIKNLVEDKIIDAPVSNIIFADRNEKSSVSPEDEKSNPVIEKFNVTDYAEKEDDNYLVESGKPFTLTWKVKNTLNVELFKNDQFFQDFDIEESDFTLKETFDGKEKTIKFTLKASNSFSTVSRSLVVTVTDKINENVIVDVYESPVINEFKVVNYRERKGDMYLVESGKNFELTWKITNALKIELFRDNKSIKIFDPQEKSIELKEQIYDGIEKEIQFDIEASNRSIEIQRRSLTVKISRPIEDLVINEFTVNNYENNNGDTYTVESGKSFTLSWKMQNAQYAELYKNGQLYKKLSGDEGNVEITEHAYDGRQKEINYTLKASAKESGTRSRSITVLVQQAPARKPVITYFKSDKTVLRNGGSYTLSWDVRDAATVQLYKNDTLYKTFYGEKSILLKENYEGKEKKIRYNLVAAKDDIQAKSNNTVTITVKSPLNIARILIIAVLAVAVVILSVLLYRSRPSVKTTSTNSADSAGTKTLAVDTAVAVVPPIDSSARTQITPNADTINTSNTPSVTTAVHSYRAANIYSDNYITITGSNLPVTPGSVRVTFNDVEGIIKSQTKKSIYVQVPEIDNTNAVKIMVYINGKQFIAANNVSYSNNKIIVDPISFNSVIAGNIVAVTGKNLPADSWVQFNNVKGDVVSQTSSSIRVKVPEFSGNVRQVNIGVCINGNKTPVRTANNVLYRIK